MFSRLGDLARSAPEDRRADSRWGPFSPLQIGRDLAAPVIFSVPTSSLAMRARGRFRWPAPRGRFSFRSFAHPARGSLAVAGRRGGPKPHRESHRSPADIEFPATDHHSLRATALLIEQTLRLKLPRWMTRHRISAGIRTQFTGAAFIERIAESTCRSVETRTSGKCNVLAGAPH
jgi:hypothetical protein